MKQNNNPGSALRALKRNQLDADNMLNKYSGLTVRPIIQPTQTRKDSLKITFLGGLAEVGEKNMAVIEFNNDAIVLDCGMSLSIDLPGVNYEINGFGYLKTIKHKLKGYVITHGHLDHMGGLKHTVPLYPAPIYGSRYTIGVIEKSFEETPFKPQLVTAKLDVQEQMQVGIFTVEFIRVTHSLPDAAAICIGTPAGRIIATGDFRLDPEPLDKMPTDVKRLKSLGDQGILLLLSESSYANAPGRVPTESTLQQTFHDIIGHAPGRIFVAAFSSNMNRTQMIINAAVGAGRKVALDGRGMLNYAEIAVRQGILKVPKGTIIPITQAGTIQDSGLLVMCTGGQGEPNAALQRMSEGTHKSITLKQGDTVVISSSPIPGNEISYSQISDRLSQTGVHLFRHPTHDVDGCGPLHVSGHARRDELREMIELVRPEFLIPVHGGLLRRQYHADVGVEAGMPRTRIILPSNGDSLYIKQGSVACAERNQHSSLLIDQNSHEVTSAVVKDRLLLSQTGIMTIHLTVNHTTKLLEGSPDIISRGFIATRSNVLFDTLQTELRRAVQQRYGRVALDQFKAELMEHIMQVLFKQTGLSPMVIIVVNSTFKSAGEGKLVAAPAPSNANQQQRFQEMRRRLLKNI